MRLLLLSLLMCVAVPVQAEEGKRYAVVVGVNAYQHAKLLKLDCAVNDAKDLAKVLRTDGYQVVDLTDDSAVKPSGEEIRKAITTMLSAAKQNDTVLIALSGHGLQFEKEAYFCPSDAKPFADEAKTLIPLTGIYTDFDKSFAGVKLLFVDACRDDPTAGRGSKGIDADSAPEPPKGVLAMFSCSAGQKSFEDPKAKRGVFFNYVIEGLQGKATNSDGEVTFTILNDYVAKRVSPRASELYAGARQTPNMVARVVGASPVLVNAEDSRITQELKARSFHPRGGEAFFKENLHRVAAWEQAAKRGNAAGMSMVSGLYLFGVGRAKDEKEALVWCHKAADLGEPIAMNTVGFCYGNGRGVTKDDKEALVWYRKAADLGSSLAMYNLGSCYADGLGVVKDDNEALLWFRKAADLGNLLAIHSLGNFYAYGRSVSKDEKQAFARYRKAAELGLPVAMNNVGICYASGLGVSKDQKEAVVWYRKAADLGQPQAMFELGNCYTNSAGVNEDVKEAFIWYRKAAELGHLQAMENTGFQLSIGSGVAQDEKEAVVWYRKAAELGLPKAMSSLAFQYSTGSGVPKDETEALRWYRKAANLGDPMAMRNLGGYFEESRLVEKDEAEAIRWYRKAAAAGDPIAVGNLKRLGKE
jgi:TPR repeat protein